MRRMVYTATLAIFCLLASSATASASSRDSLFDTVVATMDSSGVSITIDHASRSLDDDTSGTVSITVSSSSTDRTIVCVLSPHDGTIDVRRQREIDVTWTMDGGSELTIVTPSIHIAGILSNFSCEPAD